MRRIVILLSLVIAVSTAHAFLWTDLWLTPEQQAQRLLDSGKAADAADKFTDARRRAYAEIEAGKYAEGAKILEGFQDAQSQYNRGNALARSGQLENALAAYDSTIEQTTVESPLGRDARRNRELVAEQLKKQQSSQSQSGGESQEDKQNSGAEQSGKQDQRQSGNRSQSGQQDQASSGEQGQQDAGEQNGQRKSDQQQAGNGSGQPQNQPEQRGAQQPENSQRDAASGTRDDKKDLQAQRDAGTGTEKEKNDAARAQRGVGMGPDNEKQGVAQTQRDAGTGSEPEKQPTAQARRDAGTGADKEKQDAGTPTSQPGQVAQRADSATDRNNPSPAATDELPLSEQSLALDQWLRQIPDDPAGLLRRKFLIEHMRRQRTQEELQ